MAFLFHDLEPRVRSLMVELIDRDLDAGMFPYGKQLTAEGRAAFAQLLRAAALAGDERRLAEALACDAYFVKLETVVRGDVTRYRRVNLASAALRLAEGEFNRYYARAVCARAEERGLEVEVYRARASAQPRPESEALLGRRLAPRGVIDSALVPMLPNSGLSIRLRAVC